MTSAMSFQYPPPSVGGSEMDMQQTPYLPAYSIPSQQQTAGVADPRTSQLPLHDTRDPGLGLRRSFSTPNAVPYPGYGLDQAQGGLPGEKKRNKLGYHRSSVACVHCRKRKIRCVAEPTDKQGRCTNCMRLKKECSFHPVDQPSPIEARAKSTTRGTGSQRNPSASASPATSSGLPSELPAKRPLSRQILPPGIGQTGIPNPEDDDHTSLSDTASNGRLAGQAFELSSQPSVAWGSTDMHHSMQGKVGDFSGHWQPATGASDQFSPYDGLPTSPGWQTEAPGQPSHDGFPWGSMPVPARSMSYSGDAMAGHQAQFDPATQGVMYDRRASNFTGVYNPALSGPVPNVEHGAQHVMDGRAFPSGATAQDSMMWNSQPGQPSVQGSFHKGEGYDGWAYGHNTNGH